MFYQLNEHLRAAQFGGDSADMLKLLDFIAPATITTFCTRERGGQTHLSFVLRGESVLPAREAQIRSGDWVCSAPSGLFVIPAPCFGDLFRPAKSAELVQHAFGDLGWGTEACRQILGLGDEIDHVVDELGRLELLRQRLEDLRAAAGDAAAILAAEGGE